MAKYDRWSGSSVHKFMQNGQKKYEQKVILKMK